MGHRKLRYIYGTLAAVVLVAYPLAPAQASQSYDLNAGSGAGGSGRVVGSVTFKDKKHFNYGGSVTDVCPGDSYGVSLYYAVTATGGGQGATSFRAQDTDGCDNGSVPYNDSVGWPNNISHANAVMCFTNNGNLCDHVGQVSSNLPDPY